MPFTGDVLDNQPARGHNSGIDPSDSPGRHPPRALQHEEGVWGRDGETQWGAGGLGRAGMAGCIVAWVAFLCIIEAYGEWGIQHSGDGPPNGGEGGSAARTEGTAVMGESEKGSVRFGGIWRRILE